MTQKTALISGITGQDGSYLAELLLEKGYKVVGIRRRTSTFNTSRIEHLYDNPNLILEWGNITDSYSLYRIVNKYKPDEIYNLAAMSHVRVSFDVPEEALDTVAKGTLNFLNIIKEHCPKARFYQASSSEMYGVAPCPESGYTETCVMDPASPYAAAKLYAHHLVRNYRAGYGLHLNSGILFNHETVADFMPIIFRHGNGPIDIKPISEVVKFHTKLGKVSIDSNKEKYQETDVDSNLFVWDKQGWTKVTYASGYPHSSTKNSKNPKIILAKAGMSMATDTHEHIMNSGPDKQFKEIEIGDEISLVEFPTETSKTKTKISPFESYMIGYIVGDGNISKFTQIRITAKDKSKLKIFEGYWDSLGKKSNYSCGISGFGSEVHQLCLNQAKDWINEHLPDLYTEDYKKRVPKKILNSNLEIMQEFLKGYNDADGLKQNKCVYQYKNFKTNSATLAQGLLYLIHKTTKQKFCINLEFDEKWNNNAIYYSINLQSNSKYSQNKSVEKANEVLSLIDEGISLRKISRETGISRKFIQQVSRGYMPTGIHHNQIADNKVKNIVDMNDYDGWFFDLETESSTFHCGVGLSHVHNSPRRGETFVTRKITQAAARIKLGKQDRLVLGNLEAKRDWGHARDYVEAMWLMLQHDKPDDYVIATGETHSVQEFLDVVFDHANLSIPIYVYSNAERYIRPQEVPYLLGDASKAKRVLGWQPKTTFEELAIEMYESDLELTNK